MANLKSINFHALNKEELIYEVLIRSETPSATVEGLRKQLRVLSKECSPDDIYFMARFIGSWHVKDLKTRYNDVKALIKSKCGPLEVILDNLVQKNKYKSVTVGLADEGDAAILVRKINGLFMEGAHLYVEDPRQNKRKEQQPYRSSETLSNQPEDVSGQMTFGLPSMGAQSMEYGLQPQGLMPIMPFNQNIMPYGMPTYGMYMPQPAQSAGILGYGQQMMQNIPGEYQMQNPNFNENPGMSDSLHGVNQGRRNDIMKDIDNHQPASKKPRWDSQQNRSDNTDRNTRFRDISPQKNRTSDLRVKSHEVTSNFNDKGRQGSRKRDGRNPRPSGSEATGRNNRDDFRKGPLINHYDRSGFASQHDGNSSNVGNGRYSGVRPNFNKGDRTNSRYASDLEAQKEITPSRFNVPSFTQGEFREPETNMYEHEYNDDLNSFRDQYRDSPEFAQETRQRSLIPEYDRRPAETYQDYPDRHVEPHGMNFESDTHRFSPDRNEFDSYDSHHPVNMNPWTMDDNNFDRNMPQKRDFDRNVSQKSNFDVRERNVDDVSYENPRSVRRQNDRSPYRPKNFDDSRSGGPKFRESKEVQSDWRNEIPFQPNPKPTFSKRGDSGPSREPRNIHDRRPPLKPEFKPREDRRGPLNNVEKQRPVESRFTTTRPGPSRPIAQNKERARPPTKSPYDRKPDNFDVSQSKLPGPPKSAPKPHIQESLTTLINKDATYRGQATAQIAKDMIRNLQINKGESQTILKLLKVSIRSRLELILGEKMVSHLDEAVKKYRQKFSEKQDAAFFDAVLQKFESEQAKQPVEKDGNVSLAAAAAPQESMTSTPRPPKKSKALNKPAKPAADTIPKFPNADKNQMKRQKQQAKMECQDENMYDLDEPMSTVLAEEIDAMCYLFDHYECTNDEERKIANIIKRKAVPDFKKAVKLNVTKRVLDLRDNLLIRIFIHGKPPQDKELNVFLKDLGVTSCRKAKRGTFLIASCKNFEDYDRLLTMGSTNIGGCELSIKPLHLAGYKSRPTRGAVKKQRKDFIKQQIDVDGQSKVIEYDLNDDGANPDYLEDY